MVSRAASVLLAILAVGAAATAAAWGAAPRTAPAALPLANRSYQGTVAGKLPKSIGQDTFILQASASRRRVTIVNPNFNVPCTDNGGVASPQVGNSTVAVSSTGAFRFSLGSHPALVLVSRFVTRSTASGTVSWTISSDPGTCALKASWSATLILPPVTERYVGTTTGGAKVSFSVTHPQDKPSSLTVGNFAVGNVTAACPADYAFPTREISFSDGSVGPVKNGRFSNGAGAPAGSSDADLGFTASGTLTGNSASGVVGAGDPNGCGYGPIPWSAKHVP
jgi:hypothetical protein